MIMTILVLVLCVAFIYYAWTLLNENKIFFGAIMSFGAAVTLNMLATKLLELLGGL